MNRLGAMEAFVRLVETGSFSEAARSLDMGQPAVSKTIARPCSATAPSTPYSCSAGRTHVPLLLMQRVKQRRGRSPRPTLAKTTRISAKNQATLPVDVLRRAGLRAGDEVRIKAEGTGRVVIEGARHAIRRWAGCLTGAYGKGYLRDLRREWR